MNTALMMKTIPFIRKGRFPADEFSAETGLGKSIASDIIKFLAKNGIGRTDREIEFDESDKMRASILAIKMGADPEEISQLLEWKDFESLTVNILDANGYETYHGFRLKKPRMEIDVAAIKDNMALLIDCKHWKRASPSSLEKFASMQIDRAKAFLNVNNIEYAIPIILTLHSESLEFADQVPIVPMMKFRSFLNELPGYMHEIRIVKV